MKDYRERRMIVSSVLLLLALLASRGMSQEEGTPEESADGGVEFHEGDRIYLRLLDYELTDAAEPFFCVREEGAEKELLETSTKDRGSQGDFDPDDDFLVEYGREVQYEIEAWNDGWRNSLRVRWKTSGSRLTDVLESMMERYPGEPGKWTVRLTTSKGNRVRLVFAGIQREYRLVNVTIPPGSDYRNNDDISKPPKLSLIINQNGRRLLTCDSSEWSTNKKGWSVDFSDEDQNRWMLREGADDRYVIELWDVENRNYQIYTRTGLSEEDFRKNTIREIDSFREDSDLISFLFEQID